MSEMIEFHADGRRQIKVWLDGKEVTEHCFWAKVPDAPYDAPGAEGYGEVGLYEIDKATGQLVLEWVDGKRDLAKRYHQGEVRWEYIN